MKKLKFEVKDFDGCVKCVTKDFLKVTPGSVMPSLAENVYQAIAGLAQGKFDEWFKELQEEVENCFYNIECEQSCDCCLNNKGYLEVIKNLFFCVGETKGSKQ